MSSTAPAYSPILDFEPEHIESVPDVPGVFRILSFGQKIIYVGHAGNEGLREALWELYEDNVIGGAAEFVWTGCESAEAAEELAGEEIRRLKPIYNIGFDRFRNEEVSVPKQGRSVRREGLDHP